MYVNVVFDPSRQIMSTSFLLVSSSTQQEQVCIRELDSEEYLFVNRIGTINH